MTRRLTIAPWRPRILEAEAPPNAFVLEMSITEAVQRLTPRIFDPEWHEDIVASGLNWPEVYRFSHMMGVATDLTYVFAALDNFHAKKLLRRVHEAESLQFHILATSGDRAVLLVKPEGRRDGHRPTIRCAFAQPLVHLKTSWTSDCARAERDIEARIPRDAHYRAIERDQALSHALAELAARWARAIRDELAFGVVVHDAVLVRRLGAAIQRADSSAFAANFEALLADSGIEVARDGHYAVTAATCPRTRTQVLLVEFQPRQPQTTVFDIAEATEHLVPQALATPRLSGWSRPSMPGQGSGQRCLPLDGRATPGRIPEIDVLAERFEGNPRIEEAARAADAQQ
ncbi:MAG: hypothetical protein FJ100_23900, partial [Deltaproteobacteria bacterium]|nr:hypothetical protein [Deltaproteobacteria bacterium]